MYLLTLILQEDGLTLMDIISDIPHDAPAILVYILLAVSAYGIWWGNRRSGKRSVATPETAGESGDRSEPSGSLDSGSSSDATKGLPNDLPPKQSG